MKKIKILYIINSLGVGGAEKVLLLLLEELSKRDDLELTLVSLEGWGEYEDELKRYPVKIKNFNFHIFRKYLHRFDPAFRMSLFLFALKEKPDIIHGQLVKGEDFAKLLGGLLNIPVVTTLHDVMIKPGKRNQFLNRYLTKAVAVSPLTANYLETVYHIPKEKILVIPDAIKIEEFKNSKKKFVQEKPVFVYIGRIFQHKGIKYAINGLAKLLEEYPDLEFRIYGDAKFDQKYFEELTELKKKNGWDFVKFMGPTSDIPTTLKGADIFILPSKSEGFSMAALEAAAASKPIVSTKTGSISEMVEDGRSGYYVKYGSAEDIYRAAAKILKSGKVNEMGEVGYRLVKDRFRIENSANLYYNLYLEVAK